MLLPYAPTAHLKGWRMLLHLPAIQSTLLLPGAPYTLLCLFLHLWALHTLPCHEWACMLYSVMCLAHHHQDA